MQVNLELDELPKNGAGLPSEDPSEARAKDGGEGGIRTLGPVTRSTH